MRPARMACVLALLLVGATAPQARAFATVGSPPTAGPTGLPDGRVYEQVTQELLNADDTGQGYFGLASADGNAVVYPGENFGLASSGLHSDFVSRRSVAHGWQSESIESHPGGTPGAAPGPLLVTPSLDFDRFYVASQEPFGTEDPEKGGFNLFLTGGALAEPVWLGKQITNPLPALGSITENTPVIAGASSSLSVDYFTYAGTLLAEDATRAQYVAIVAGAGLPGSRSSDPWGFYEWDEGKLVNAGTLPDGSLNPFGAVPASIAGMVGFVGRRGEAQADSFDNQVSEDGTRAFFVSPDPAAVTASDPTYCASLPPCTSEPPQLYVREPGPGGAKTSVLVSASQLPGHEGEAAPTGVVSMSNSTARDAAARTDAYASADGSHVLFASNNQLTSAAPDDETAKIYDYDVDSGALTYLPGVTAPIAQVSHDGSEALFEDTSGATPQIDLWRSGAAGGSVTPIGELGTSELGGPLKVNEAHFSTDGSVVVFRTNATIPGGFNNGKGHTEIYRYDSKSSQLDCVSCPPAGVTPSGNAQMSQNNDEEGKPNAFNGLPTSTLEARGMSSDGNRVFFDTTEALVPQDVNGKRDVYEWENGQVFLISSGSSTEGSVYLDSDIQGENTFFITASALNPGDTDGSYDVYDARIPRPGDSPPAAVPCKGAVCQGPPSVPELLGQPASETFTGAGNLEPVQPSSGQSAPKSLTRAQKLARALRACKRRKPRSRRKQCERQARGRYGANVAGAHAQIEETRHHDRRGN